MECPMCEGESYPMGILGNIEWYRCRCCGWEFSRSVDQAERYEHEVQSVDSD